jgi:hypothetical protein
VDDNLSLNNANNTSINNNSEGVPLVLKPEIYQTLTLKSADAASGYAAKMAPFNQNLVNSLYSKIVTDHRQILTL